MSEMKQVFISYTTCDKEKATAIRDFLENEGNTCWMGNRDIPGGANYTKEITTAIRKCQAFVLILSTAAQRSEYVFRELDFAIKQRKTVIPYLIEEQDITDEFYFLISSTNGIHAFEDPHEGQMQLLLRIKELTSNQLTPFATNTKKKPGRKIIVCPRCRGTKLRRSISLRDAVVESSFLAGFTFLLLLIPIVCGIVFFQDDIQNFLSLHGVVPDSFLYNPVFYFSKRAIAMLSRIYPSWNEHMSLDTAVWIVTWIITISFTILTFALGHWLQGHLCAKRYLSGISFHTFRCCRCNKKFRKKIPIREQNKYFIKELIEDGNPDLIERFINIFA